MIPENPSRGYGPAAEREMPAWTSEAGCGYNWLVRASGGQRDRTVLNRTGHLVAWAVVLAGVCRGGEPPLKMEDPAVPKVHRPTSQPAEVQSRPHRAVKVFAKPRPLPAGAVTGDWPTFLGPTHNAVCRETKLLKDFTSPAGKAKRPALLWQMVRGQSYAAPAVVGERVVVFHRVGNEEVVECLDAEGGGAYWQFRYPTAFEDRYGYNNGPRSTPAIAGDLVLTYGAEGKLHCLDLRTGRLCWKRDVAKEFDIRLSFFGAACSPLVEGGRVILNIGGRNGPSVVAFDAESGRLLWGAEKQWGAGYASPVPATIHGKRVVFVFTGGWSNPATGGLLCLDPRTGRTHFRFPWRGQRVESVNASSPVVVDDAVFISSIYGFSGAMLRVRPDLTHTEAYRTRDYSSHWMTPIAREGHLYGFADTMLVCMDLKTGKEVWSDRPPRPKPWPANEAPPTGRLGRASLLWVDGAFLCLGEYGDLCWMDITPKGMKVTSRAKLFHAPQTWVGPVVSRGLLYVCQTMVDKNAETPPRLLCYDLRGGT